LKKILLIGPKYVTLLLARNWVLRYVTLRFARGLGHINYVLNREWISPVLGFIATVLVVWIVDQAASTLASISWFPLKTLLQSLEKWIQSMWSNPWSFLALYTLLWLLRWAWQARHRLVVETFVNYTDKQLDTDVRGLATLLVVRLGQLHDLYRTVDEQRAISTSVLENESIDATIKVEDIDELLKDAVSSQSELSLGPLKIPVGTLLSLIGRFVQGPRILGSLHNDGGKLILTAQSVGRRNSFKWRVDQVLTPVQSMEPHSPDLVSMVQELACRIFTDLALNGSVRWKATNAFSEGLREYRECLHIPKDRRAHLKQAEKKFIETLAEDVKFDMAYYNLGVVYTELGYTKAAETAFEQAITQSPNSWEAYYALASSRYDSKNYHRTIQLCKRVIELKPKDENLAKAYQLKGLAERALYNVKKELLDKETKGKIKPDEYERDLTQLQSGYLKDSVKSRKRAVMHSWVALCFDELSKQDAVITKESKISRLETLASVCVADLAEVDYKVVVVTNDLMTTGVRVADLAEVDYKRGKKVQRAKFLLKQALSLTHADGSYRALYHFKLGKVYLLQDKYADATNKLRRATRIAPDCVTYWAELAVAYAYAVTREDKDKSSKKETRDENYEKYVLETIIDSAPQAAAKDFRAALDNAEEAYKMIDAWEERNKDRSQSMKQVKAFVDLSYFYDLLDSVEEPKKKDEFEEKLRYHEQNGSEYEHAKVFLTLGHLYLKCDEEQNYEELIMALEQELGQHNCKGEELVNARISLTLGQWYHKCNEKQKTAELIKKLEPQLKDFERDGKEWGYGQCLQILAKLYLLVGEFGMAEKKCRLAIQKLEEKYPHEVRLLHLRPLLATALSKQGKHCEAVQVVQQAASIDALDCYTREHLGDMYLERGDFERAVDAWREALSLKSVHMQSPHDPEIDFKIGKAYAQFALQHHKLSQRKIENQKALEYLKHALDRYENDQQKQKLAVYHYLGYFHFALGEYEDAIKHFRVTQRFGFAQLTSTFYLGYAFLRLREYDEAIGQFYSLYDCADKLRQKKPLMTIIEPEQPLENFSLGDMLALAKWGQAFVYAERGTNLQVGLKLINDAQELIQSTFGKHNTDQARFPALYLDCKGWILHKQGKSNDAIQCLENAVKLEAKAEIYFHLALAYEARLQKALFRKQRQNLIKQVRTCCKHIQELDLDGQYEQQVNDLLQRL
jgi:tetratricopeptide (TPR) repeat protein